MELDMSIVEDYIRISCLCKAILLNPLGYWDIDILDSYWNMKRNKDIIDANTNLNQVFN